MEKIQKSFKDSNLFKKISSVMSADENLILVIFLVIISILFIFLPKFREPYNILIVLRQFSLITIVAVGHAIVLISGTFDLSVGAIVAMSNMAVAYMMVFLGWPIWISIILAILVGTVCGLINGFLVAKVKINPLIATLASSWVYAGILLITTLGHPIVKLPEAFDVLGQGYFLRIPLPVWFMILVGIIATIFLSKTVNGRFIYAIGDNEKAAVLAGLNVSNLRMLSYMICGTLCGFAGVLLVSRVGTAQVTAGTSWTLPSVAAAVIGGVRIFGGKGRIYGVLVGSAILGIINNVLVLIGVSSYYQSFISGLILILAVSVDALRSRSKLI